MSPAPNRPGALFVGLCTLDVIQLVDHVPAADEKLASRDQVIAAGGPAANAAATFSHLGGAAVLLTGIGTHPLAAGITADLAAFGVDVVDLIRAGDRPPTVSSILVTAATGQRAVASINAARHRLPPPDHLDALVAAADVLEFDGHHMELARAAAQAARRTGRLTVFDGGSWKDGTEDLLPFIDVAVCSDDFHPPGMSSPAGTLAFLHAHGVRWAAVSRGRAPILWSGPKGGGEVEVPDVPVVDTLGAGDVLHGALAYHLARHGAAPPDLDADRFSEALTFAARIASRACASFGTRSWMLSPPSPPPPARPSSRAA
jgi:sugar/nucleoside kinase (ribokinase family)